MDALSVFSVLTSLTSQGGTSGYDTLDAVVRVSNDLMVAAGASSGSYGRENDSGNYQGVAVLLDTNSSTSVPGPLPSPAPDPMSSSSPADPTPAPLFTPAPDPGPSPTSDPAPAPAFTSGPEFMPSPTLHPATSSVTRAPSSAFPMPTPAVSSAPTFENSQDGPSFLILTVVIASPVVGIIILNLFWWVRLRGVNKPNAHIEDRSRSSAMEGPGNGAGAAQNHGVIDVLVPQDKKSPEYGEPVPDHPQRSSATVVESSSSANPNSADDSGALVTNVVVETTQRLAHRSDIPGVSEAAVLLSTLVHLALDSEGNDSVANGRLRWCQSVSALLERAAGALDKVGDDQRHGARVITVSILQTIERGPWHIRSQRCLPLAIYRGS